MVGQQDVVAVGSSVRVRDGDVVEDWTIVDGSEADARARRISDGCPLAQALLGHVAGEQVRVQGPRRWWVVSIVAVAPGS
jgi:transcription elongation GreA/GreB family factor